MVMAQIAQKAKNMLTEVDHFPSPLSEFSPPLLCKKHSDTQEWGRGFYKLKRYEGYCVTQDGMVWTHKKEKYLNIYDVDKRGWLCVALMENGVNRNRRLHRLVAETFIPNPKNKPSINHVDCDKSNNNVENLEWVTNKENTAHAIKNGLFHNIKDWKKSC